jgi:hypothetical protein
LGQKPHNIKSKLKSISIVMLFLFLICCHGQNQELEYRSIEYYLQQISELEYNALLEQNLLVDSVTIADEYFNKNTNQLNEKGFKKYVDIQKNIYMSFFKDYLYQQHIVYNDDVYVLYFTLEGSDDIEWNVVKWKKDKWNNEDRLDRDFLKTDSLITKLFWNYDEGPKNIENIKIFIKYDYLVLERGNLYHSLYDLKTYTVLVNEESPFHASGGQDKEKMNEWIKINLHDKIEKYFVIKENKASR